MRMGPIVFFSSRNCHGESILFWGKRTCGIGRDCARRIVGSIKVNLHSSIHHRIGFQEAASWVGIGFARQIIEDERQAF
jgi:hypothetical protein